MRGALIAFEGIDGAGKFTQLHRTKGWLEDADYIVGWSSEPNRPDWGSARAGSPLGGAIDAVLTGKEKAPEDPFEFQRMYVLDRAQDIFCFIRPHLTKGHPFLIERYALSTIAYGMLSGRPAEDFIRLHSDVLGPSMLWPHVTVLLDVSGKEAARRIAESRGKPEYFERADKLERVRANYLAIAKRPEFEKKVLVVNGELSEDEVFADVRSRLLGFFGE